MHDMIGHSAHGSLGSLKRRSRIKSTFYVIVCKKNESRPRVLVCPCEYLTKDEGGARNRMAQRRVEIAAAEEKKSARKFSCTVLLKEGSEKGGCFIYIAGSDGLFQIGEAHGCPVVRFLSEATGDAFRALPAWHIPLSPCRAA